MVTIPTTRGWLDLDGWPDPSDTVAMSAVPRHNGATVGNFMAYLRRRSTRDADRPATFWTGTIRHLSGYTTGDVQVMLLELLLVRVGESLP